MKRAPILFLIYRKAQRKYMKRHRSDDWVPAVQKKKKNNNEDDDKIPEQPLSADEAVNKDKAAEKAAPTIFGEQALYNPKVMTQAKGLALRNKAESTRTFAEKIIQKEMDIQALIPDLEELDLKNVKDNESLLFIGKRHTGKTVGVGAVLDRFHTQPNIKMAAVVSGSEKANGFYSDHIPLQNIMTEYNADYLTGLFELQEYYTALKDAGHIKEVPVLPVILDDIAWDHNQFFSDALNKTYMLGRHVHILPIITTQYMKSISKKIRSNSDWVFVFKLLSPADLDAVWEQYGSRMRKDVFSAMLEKYTEGYSCLVINQKTNEKGSTHIYFRKQFPFPVAEFKFGNAEEWRIAREMKKEMVEATITAFEEAQKAKGVQLKKTYSQKNRQEGFTEEWELLWAEHFGETQGERINSLINLHKKKR